MHSSKPLAMLGGLSQENFLAHYWHKKPLLIRQALPGFGGLLTPAELMALAGRDEVEARLVTRPRGGWRLAHGPFAPAHFARLPTRNWTLLVQSVDHWLDAGTALIERFNFIPHARLDDLMVSYAVPGGGVGPHFDSYDVFLLQGMGRRRWRISAQKNLELVANIPLRILRRFEAEQEWLLEPGDMLYLPPHCAHDGVAESECMTYSIGFRAPAAQELAVGFLDWLHEHLDLPGRYADPALRPQRHPAEVSGELVEQVAAMLEPIRWTHADVARFAGCWFSEPKPTVFFDPPARPPGMAAFARKLARTGVKLDRRSRLLFSGGRFFCNGEETIGPREARAALRVLADQRRLVAGIYPHTVLALLHAWYEAGWLQWQ